MKRYKDEVLTDLATLKEDTFEEIYQHKIEELRWGKGSEPISPWVPNSKVYALSSGQYRCSLTQKNFTVRTRTIFERSKLTWRQWVVIINEYLQGNTICNTHQIARQLQITQKTAWHAIYKIRLCCQGKRITSEITIMDVLRWGLECNTEEVVVPPEPHNEPPVEQNNNDTRFTGETPLENIKYLISECLRLNFPIPQEFITYYHECLK